MVVAGAAGVLVGGSSGVAIGKRAASSAASEQHLAAERRAAREHSAPPRPEAEATAAAPAAAPPASARPREPDARSKEIMRLRQEAADAQRALDAANQRLAALEARQQRRSDPRDFDLSPEDWRQLARQGTLKLRVPCAGGQVGGLGPAQLEQLGLDAGDGPIIDAAMQHSTERMWAKLGPLCARALGISVEAAARVGLRDCRHRVLGQGMSDGTALPAYRRAASYLAGDAPEPTGDDAVEQLVVSMAREQRLIIDELAQHFGPDEAERLVFSRAFCFTEATHELGGQAASAAAPDSAPGGAAR